MKSCGRERERGVQREAKRGRGRREWERKKERGREETEGLDRKWWDRDG